MQEYSEIAWGIASKYSGILASETRDLAAWIDKAITSERERCAEIAEIIGAEYAAKNKLSLGIELASALIAESIRNPNANPVKV